jgi:hypothetical protein
MAQDRTFGEVLKELHDRRLNGALYVTIKETSEDLFRIYFVDGEIVFIRYGTAQGKECLDIIEFYTLASASWFDGVMSPQGMRSGDLPETGEIVRRMTALRKPVRFR